MSDPRRLFDGGSPDEVAMLEAAKSDGPSPEAERGARIALGLAAPMLPSPAPDPITPAAHAGAATAGTAAVKAGLVLIAAAGATAGWIAAREPAPSIASLPPAAAPAAEADLELEPVQSAPLVHRDGAAAPSPRVDARRGVRVVAPAPDPDARLRREIDLVRAARRAEDPAEAEALLDRYDREIGRGVFIEEVDLLRVETAHALDRDDRVERAQAFLRDHPGSPHGDRVRALSEQPPR
jgi:hypothetical protein